MTKPLTPAPPLSTTTSFCWSLTFPRSVRVPVFGARHPSHVPRVDELHLLCVPALAPLGGEAQEGGCQGCRQQSTPTERPAGGKSPCLWWRALLPRTEGGLIIFLACPRVGQACPAYRGGSGRFLSRSPPTHNTYGVIDGCEYFCCWYQEASSARLG